MKRTHLKPGKPPKRKVSKAESLWKRLSKFLRKINPWCEWCGGHSRLSCHHPLRRGQSKRWDLYSPNNIVVLCQDCHGKADRSEEAFWVWLKATLPAVNAYHDINLKKINRDWDGPTHLPIVTAWLPYIEMSETLDEFRQMPRWQE